MHGFILWCGIVNLIFLLFPFKVFASDVRINEIFANPENEEDEFVELYNQSDSELDLSGWKIADLVKSYTLEDIKINPREFLILDKSQTGIALNNSDETVILSNPENEEADKFSYSETIEGKSWSRVPDGLGDFYNNTEVSKSSANYPAPTSTPTNAPSPTKTPKPPKAPTSTKVPTDIPSPTEVSIENSLKEDDKDKNSNKVMGISAVSKSNSKNVTKDEKNIIEEEIVEESVPTYLYSFTTGIGMLMLGCAILLYRIFKAKKDEEDF